MDEIMFEKDRSYQEEHGTRLYFYRSPNRMFFSTDASVSHTALIRNGLFSHSCIPYPTSN